MKTTLNPAWINLELNHKHGGDGFAIVQELGDDMCRVAWPDKDGKVDRAILAWQKLLTPTMRSPGKDRDGKTSLPPVIQPFDVEQVTALDALRSDLESGKLVVRCQRIEKP
jgi:hypothetical protein